MSPKRHSALFTRRRLLQAGGIGALTMTLPGTTSAALREAGARDPAFAGSRDRDAIVLVACHVARSSRGPDDAGPASRARSG